MWLKFFTSKGGVKMNVNERYLIGIIILLSATAVVFDKHTVSLWLLMISFIVCLNKLICEISDLTEKVEKIKNKMFRNRKDD